MTAPRSTAPVVLTRRIHAPCREVFRAWSDPDILSLWIAPGPVVVERATIDLTLGGGFKLETRGLDGSRHTISGIYRAIVPDRRLALTWTYHGPLDLEPGRETLLEIDLVALGDGGTELTLTHRLFERGTTCAAYAAEWPSCLDKLEDTLGQNKQGGERL